MEEGMKNSETRRMVQRPESMGSASGMLASPIDTLMLWPFLSFQCNYVKRIFAQPHSLAVLVALLSPLYFPLIIHPWLQTKLFTLRKRSELFSCLLHMQLSHYSIPPKFRENLNMIAPLSDDVPVPGIIIMCITPKSCKCQILSTYYREPGW